MKKTSDTAHKFGLRLPALRQGGFASLTIGVVLLFMLSLITVYLTRSGIVDLRSSANKARYAEALAEAERRLEVGMAWMSLSANRATLGSGQANDVSNDTLWPLCSSFVAPFSNLGGDWRCRQLSLTYTASSGAQTDTFVVATPNDARGEVYQIIATGASADGTGSAVVRQGAFFYAGMGDGLGHAPPLMGAGNIPLNGTFSVVANPNGGGTGVPISIWSKVSISAPSGSSATCQLHEYLQDGDCTSGAISNSSKGKQEDIVDNDPNFPDDVFQFVFGVPTANYGAIKAQATQVANCSGLNAASTGIIWVNGSCSISGTVGSEAAPVILVVESADFTMNANSRFYGLLFAFGPNGDAGSITANGGAKFYGSMISNDAVTMGININGTFDMVYSDPLVKKIAINGPGNIQYRPMARIPGSWADYL